MAALPNVKITGKQTKAQERAAKIAHATQVAAAAAAGQGPQAEAVLAARAEQYRQADEALANIPRRVRGKQQDPKTGGRLKRTKKAAFLPFHDIADDPYFIRV